MWFNKNKNKNWSQGHCGYSEMEICSSTHANVEFIIFFKQTQLIKRNTQKKKKNKKKERKKKNTALSTQFQNRIDKS